MKSFLSKSYIEEKYSMSLDSLKILKGGDELFFEKAVVEFFRKVIEDWNFNSKSIALLLGCSHNKPYSKSFIHRKVIGLLRKYDLEREVQQYIVGEPLVIVPREWEKIYPAAHYDFPPERLGEVGRYVFIRRLRRFMEISSKHHEKFIVFAPNHHRKIILEASKNIVDLVTVPYNVYNLPKLLDTIFKVRDYGKNI